MFRLRSANWTVPAAVMPPLTFVEVVRVMKSLALTVVSEAVMTVVDVRCVTTRLPVQVAAPSVVFVGTNVTVTG